MKKWTSLLSLVLVIGLVLTACGGNSNGSAGGATEGAGKAEGESEAQTRAVNHAMGTSNVPTHPKRVVVLTNEGTEALLELGIKPVGAVKSWTGDPWYNHIKADMEGVVDLGEEGQPNLEAILSLQPDLILGTKMRHEALYQQLSDIAPTVFSETLRGEWKENLLLWADAVNKKTEGEQLIQNFDKRVEDFRTKAGDQLNKEVSIVRFMPGKVRIYYKQTFSGIIFDQIGIKRPVAQQKDAFADDVSKERIPEMDGDLMFYFVYETGNQEASKLEEEWTKDKLWQNLNVVKNNQVFRVDDAIWNTAGGVRAANLMLDDLYKQYNLEK